MLNELPGVQYKAVFSEGGCQLQGQLGSGRDWTPWPWHGESLPKIIFNTKFCQTNGHHPILNRTPAWTKSMWQGLWRTASRQRLSNIFWCPRRCISTTYLDPSLRAFTSSLVQQQPVFELPSSSIQILAEPSQFYKTLLVFIFRIHLRSYLTFGRTWLNELNAEYSSPRSTLIPQSLSLCVIFIHFLPSFQCFNGIDFYAGKPPSRKAWSESLFFTWPEPFNASGSIMHNKFFTPSITRLSITCTYFNVSKSQLTRYSRQNSPSTF